MRMIRRELFSDTSNREGNSSGRERAQAMLGRTMKVLRLFPNLGENLDLLDSSGRTHRLSHINLDNNHLDNIIIRANQTKEEPRVYASVYAPEDGLHPLVSYLNPDTGEVENNTEYAFTQVEKLLGDLLSPIEDALEVNFSLRLLRQLEEIREKRPAITE